MNLRTSIHAIGAALLGSTATLQAYDALTRPTELQYWDSTRAQNGYTFFGVGGTSYLLDMLGRVVHSWPVGNNPHLQDDGSILDASTDDPSGFGGFKIVSWDGVTTWSYTESRSTYHPHHDFTRVFNKKLNAYTVLYIANKDFTQAELLAAGANPATTPSTGGQMDALVEVDSTGTVVWEWCFFDHLVQDYDNTKSNYVGTVGTGTSIGTCPGRLNINLSGHSLKSDWLHCNSVDYNPTLDQIVVNSVQGEFYVIDHGNTFVLGDPTASKAKAATGAGDFLYRFGDPARYNQGGPSGNAAPTVSGSVPAVLEDWTQSTTGTKQMGGAHDIQWIPEGLTGAGHFLIFNNAEYLSEHTSQSYVFEINPYLDASGTDTGSYVNPPAAGYNTVAPLAVTDKATKLISKQVVWNYSTKSNLTVFSQIGCSAQRLPNGNTLICADTEGYIQEMTPTGDCVWDYIVPVTPGGKVQTIGDRLPMINSIFRAYRYTATHPALAGRTLTGTTTITGRTTVDNPYAGTSNYQAMQRATETQYWDATNAANGYTFFGAQGISYLIDMAGRKVHTWPTGTDARLLDSGNVLDWATNTSGNTGLKELDWSGSTAWEYYETRSSYHPHGDFKRIYDPKLGAYATLYLANKDVTSAQCLAAGCDPADAPYVGAQIETIVEVDMSGNIIWEWSFWDHAIQNVDSSKANYGTSIASYPGKIDLNLPGRPLQSNWLDCNSLDFNQSLNQIVVNSRQGEFYIIDHGNTFLTGNPSGSTALAATSAGDFIYRFGDPARYGQGTPPSVSLNWENAVTGNKQIGASSNAQWIATGLSGAGHLLVFSNNQYLYQRTPQSYVFEINPFLNSSGVDTGSYVNPPTAGYTTWTFSKDTMKANQSLSSQVTWKYGSVGCHTLFSHFGSSVQRLSNGNTLICGTTTGYLVEVDTSGNVVWEYINPVTNSGVVTAIGDCLPMTNAVPRAMRFPASFAGFTGHTLTPGTTIAGKTVAVDELPSLANTARTPAAPTVSDAVWVTSTITDDGSVASAALTYTATTGTLTTTTPFTETFGTTATSGTNNWTGGTGTGTDNIWTVVAQPSSFKLGTSSNYVNSSPAVGVQYNCSKAATATLTSSSINAAGTSGSVTFWVKTTGTLSGNDGWTFLLGSGSTYTQVTPSAGTANSNGFTPYTYSLDSSQLVNGLQLQFRFTGNGGTDTGRISLDQITVTVTTGSSSSATVGMLDDGAHGDGAAGDHVYGAQIPAQALGTVVTYYLTATDNSGQIAKDPAAAPTTTYSYTVAAANTAPTVATAASATPSPVTGTTTTLAALGADVDTGESTLTYTWAATTLPSSATTPTFSANGSNAAKSTTATFSKAGTYGLTVTIADPGGLTVTSSVSVTVAQTLTAIAVGPSTVSLAASATQQFSATANDQFGVALTTQPGFTWTSTVTGGTISSSGLFTAPASTASGTVTATSGAVTGNASVTVANTAPTVVTAASATPSPITGTTTALTALGADADTGEGTLNYTWAATTLPSGTTTPTFSANGSNAAKSTTATFSKAGTYGLTVTIADPGGLTVTSSVSVTVAQTLTAIAVGPSTVSLAASATQQFSATANDQFGVALTTQPGFTWTSTVTGGTISSSGLFTAPATTASGTVTATSGAVSGNASVTVANTAPTVATVASATPSPVTGITTALTALGADADTGESTLTYTWAATTLPSGATTPSFSANGSNAAKSTTATFSKAGTYDITVMIADPGGLTVTSSVSVTVAQTLTAIAVTPATVSLAGAATQQFSATANDQFGIALTTQPTFTWASTVTSGTISSGGLFTAPATSASGTVTASSGAVTGNASVTVTSQSHPYTMTALPDTGQVASYSTIFGEDADYTINPPTYKDNGDGTITDMVTGLMWQQVDGGEMTWEQAVAYADSLSLGGHSDWRLAFAKELYSIMDQGTINPAINTSYFPATAAEYWWSADVAVDDVTKVWVTNAGGGIGPHPKTETLSAGGSKRFHVRCVRDPSASGATHLYGSLTNNGDGTVTDNHTGLTWQQAESATMTWENAMVYAENLTLGGHGDWRLPNIKELQSISDGNLRAPSLDKTCFIGATTTFYWSSTSLANDTTQAWYLDCDYGLTSYAAKTGLWHVRCVRGGTATTWNAPALKPIPAGSFVMGDHFGFSDPDHPSDELPLHTVAISAFSMGTYDITNRQYCTYLNAALAQGLIEVRNGLVYAVGGTTIYCETREGESALFGIIYSGIEWDGTSFSVLANRDNHPMVGVRWEGAAAYCNWLSAVQGYQSCYNLSTWVCDFAKSGYRLPTEAEWEYAANGGHTAPYYQFPWGSNTNTDGSWSNWENSGDPYETGDYPWTTPVGFYDGTLHAKSDFNWPGSQSTYQTSNAVNGYGLYDMGGNVWQWVNDWYGNGYYSVSPSSNPTGPTTGDAMPDGKAYRGMRGGTWYNGAQYLGLSRISNRDPGYYRGPQDPNHPYYHVGFRVALKSGSLVQAGATITPVVGNLQFGEGPAADASGNVFFSDITANTIYKWSTAGVLTTFRTGSGGANGLAFDGYGNLIACEGTNGRIVSITPAGVVTVIAAQYNGKRFNEPNDLWIAPNGGIYFTDPVFFGTQVQDAQAVYYINPARTTVTRVIGDMVQPNGLVGTSDGTTLYVSDYGAGATYKYTINSDGSLTGKTLFVAVGSDGMEIDSSGNIYLTSSDVLVYSSAGTLLQTINVPDRPTNLCFAGADRRTLFITTETAMVSIAVVPQGLAVTVANAAPTIALITCTPTAPTAADAPWITSRITDDTSVASATLTYSTGSGSATTTTVFTETMASTASKPWTGGGTVNAWSVTGSSYIEQRTGSNYGAGNACGMEYKAGATANALTAAMINTTSSINAAGASAYVEFWIQTLTLTGTAGWTFQLDPTGTGSSYVTRLSELTGSSHGWQKYHYDLTSGELVGTLKMRFQFTGGGAGTDHRIDLDQITVVVTSAGGITSATVTMLDDGLHGDGAAGDGIYGGQIPAKPVGTTVSYYLTATDGAGLATTSGTLSYTVAVANHAPTVATAAAATPATVTGTTTALSALGADADTAESTLTYTWAATTLPSGATAPGFSTNGSNAAKNSTATFSKAGTYGFTVTIADPGGLTVTSAVSVTVAQTLAVITVSPATTSLNVGATQQFSAAANDQFGNTLAAPPTFTWTTTVTGGAISSSGLFTAPGTAASGTVTAASGAVSGNATVASVTSEPSMGLFFNNTAKAYEGYTLMAPMHYKKTYLINNAGEVVHRWSSAYEPGRSAYLLENGHMIRACMIMSGGPSTGGGEGGRIEEYDWDGNMVWAFDYYSSNYIAHHDFKVLPNGNVLVLVAEKKTYAEVIAAGFDPSLLDSSISTSGYMLPDCLVEVTPTKPYGGTVVWEWHIWDHTIQDVYSAKSNYGIVANHPELIDVNGTGIKIPQFWNHVNGIDYNAELDQVMLSIRGNSEVFVIDHQTTTAQAASHAGGRYGKGGDILYRWGNPQQYNRGTNANQQLFQQHHTHWIPTGCPGAGNILIFNNGIGRGYSTVNQIVPPVDAAGNYTIAAGSAFGPTSPVWTYQSNPATDFYSAEISGCQRLPNGNTLICEGVKGNLFEVTSAGECVWQYLCPVTDAGPLTQGGSIAVDPVRADQYMNAVFRVYRYGPTYAGLLGRDLTSQGTIELPLDQTLRMASVTRTSGATSGSSPMSMSWVSLPDKAYQVQFSTSLTTGTWTTIATVQSIGTLTTFTDTNAARLGLPKGFYRVALAP